MLIRNTSVDLGSCLFECERKLGNKNDIKLHFEASKDTRLVVWIGQKWKELNYLWRDFRNDSTFRRQLCIQLFVQRNHQCAMLSSCLSAKCCISPMLNAPSCLSAAAHSNAASVRESCSGPCGSVCNSRLGAQRSWCGRKMSCGFAIHPRGWWRRNISFRVQLITGLVI